MNTPPPDYRRWDRDAVPDPANWCAADGRHRPSIPREQMVWIRYRDGTLNNRTVREANWDWLKTQAKFGTGPAFDIVA